MDIKEFDSFLGQPVKVKSVEGRMYVHPAGDPTIEAIIAKAEQSDFVVRVVFPNTISTMILPPLNRITVEVVDNKLTDGWSINDIRIG